MTFRLGAEAATLTVRPWDVPEDAGVSAKTSVPDMACAKRFYGDGLRLAVNKDNRTFVSFRGRDGASDLAMCTRDAPARDAVVRAAGTGCRGFTIGHIAESAESVDALLDAAACAGGTIVKPPTAARGDGYGRYFAAPDGCLWHVTARS